MTTAAALAIALPATGLIIAVVAAMWRGLGGRIDEQGRRLDEHGRRLDGFGNRFDDIGRQLGEIQRSLGRLEGRRGIPAEPPAAAAEGLAS